MTMIPVSSNVLNKLTVLQIVTADDITRLTFLIFTLLLSYCREVICTNYYSNFVCLFVKCKHFHSSIHLDCSEYNVCYYYCCRIFGVKSVNQLKVHKHWLQQMPLSL